MGRSPAAAARVHPAPTQRHGSAARSTQDRPLAVPLAALAVPDQLTVSTLYQWVHTFHLRLVPLHDDPPALQRAINAAMAQAQWSTLFHAVQELGATRVEGGITPQDTVLHDIRGSFATLAAAMELVVADVGDWGTEHRLVGLVQDHLHTLGRLIPDLVCLHPGDSHRR